MKTGPQNEMLKSLIESLRKRGYAKEGKLWARLAQDLEKSARNRRVVNLSRINRFAREGEMVVVPGKVLASGELDKNLTIAAWQFSSSAKEKIQKANGKAVLLSELASQDKVEKARIIG